MTEQERAQASAEHYRRMRAELDRRLSLDPELRRLSGRIRDGKADFSDTAAYSEIVSHHIGRIMQENVGSITNPLGKQYVCEALLKDHYETINDVLGEVQVSIDEKMNIHLNPVKPKFSSERVAQVAHALEDPTVPQKVIERRAKAPVTNVAMSYHDDYIKENAKIRAKLGMKPTITRYGSGCCKWCSEVAGKYRFGEQPKDVFRRHDNCNCTIIYDTQVLSGHQSEDGGRSKKWEEVNPAEVQELGFSPTVNTREQAEMLEAEQLEFMSNSFRPAYSERQSTFRFGATDIPTYRVRNSQFDLFTDTPDRRSKAVRLVEKQLRHIKQKLPDDFELPPILVVDFDKFGLNVDSKGNVHDVIGGFAPESGILYMNSQYNTSKKILEFVTKNQGRFANQTEYAPVLHELGHKFYEDSVKSLAISGEMSYNKAKDKIDSRIFEYIKDRNTDGRFVLKNISRYANKGYEEHSYTEIIAECFSVSDTNLTANELLRLLRE